MIHLSIDLTIALEHVNDWTYRPLAFQGGRVAIIMNEIICPRLSSTESLESNRLICFSATGNFSFFLSIPEGTVLRFSPLAAAQNAKYFL